MQHQQRTLCASSSAMIRPVSARFSKKKERQMLNIAQAALSSMNGQLRSIMVRLPGRCNHVVGIPSFAPPRELHMKLLRRPSRMDIIAAWVGSKFSESRRFVNLLRSIPALSGYWRARDRRTSRRIWMRVSKNARASLKALQPWLLGTVYLLVRSSPPFILDRYELYHTFRIQLTLLQEQWHNHRLLRPASGHVLVQVFHTMIACWRHQYFLTGIPFEHMYTASQMIWLLLDPVDLL